MSTSKSSSAGLYTPRSSFLAPVSPITSRDYRTTLSSSFEESLMLILSKRKQIGLGRPKNEMTPAQMTFKGLKTPASSSEVPANTKSSCADMAIQRYSIATGIPKSSKVDPTTIDNSFRNSVYPKNPNIPRSLFNFNCLKRDNMPPKTNPTPTKIMQSSFGEDSTNQIRSCADLVNEWNPMSDTTALNDSLEDSQSLSRCKEYPITLRRARKNPKPIKVTCKILNTPMDSSADLEMPCWSSGFSVSLTNSEAYPIIQSNSDGELLNLSSSSYNPTFPRRLFGESINLKQVKVNPIATRRSRKNPAPMKISFEILPTPPKLLPNNYHTMSKVRNRLRKFSTVLMNIKEYVNIIGYLVSKYRQSVLKISDAINSACSSLNTSPDTSNVNSSAVGQITNRGRRLSRVPAYCTPNLLLQINRARAEVDADFLDSKILKQRVTRISTHIFGYLRTTEMEAKEKLEGQSPNDDIISINVDALPLTEVHVALNIIHQEILYFKANRKFKSQKVATLKRDVLSFSRIFHV